MTQEGRGSRSGPGRGDGFTETPFSQRFFISEFILPTKLDELMRRPAVHGRTREWVMFQYLTMVATTRAKVIGPQKTEDLTTFLKIFRIAAYPNMDIYEKKRMRERAAAHGWKNDMVNPQELGPTMAIVWEIFGFRIPEPGEADDIFRE